MTSRPSTARAPRVRRKAVRRQLPSTSSSSSAGSANLPAWSTAQAILGNNDCEYELQLITGSYIVNILSKNDCECELQLITRSYTLNP